VVPLPVPARHHTQTAASVATESGYADQSHLHREVKTFTGLTPTAVAVAPWLAIDDVAWPASSPTRNPVKGSERAPTLVEQPARDDLAPARCATFHGGHATERAPLVPEGAEFFSFRNRVQAVPDIPCASGAECGRLDSLRDAGLVVSGGPGSGRL
jgi:hypothetical protein